MNNLTAYSKFDPNLPSLLEDKWPMSWQMTRWEKHTFFSLVNQSKPKVAIEIGNAYGGSLQVLSAQCEKVYALDFQQSVHDKLAPHFTKNVIFKTGDSRVILPQVLAEIQAKGEQLGFVFIDGDHSTEGVKADINNVLHHYQPICDLIILFHDSYNPICREGIRQADWQKNQYVHYVEIDFIPGNYYPEKFGACEAGSLWNGFSLAVLKPYPRKGNIEVRESLESTYKILYQHSVYNSFKRKHYYPFKQRIKNILRGKK